MRLEQTTRIAGRIGAVAAMMSLACSSAPLKGGEGGGGGTGASGGFNTGAAGGGHPGGGVPGGGHPGGDGGASGAAGGGHPGGDGGSNADAGVDRPAGGNGGAGGAKIDPLTLPGCLSDLLSACPVSTSCVSSTSDAGDVTTACFAAGGTSSEGGARATVTRMMGSSDYPNEDCGLHFNLVTVFKPDGSLCFSFEDHEPVAYDCTVHTWTWKDALGFGVATGSSQVGPGSATATITCAPGGDSAASTSCAESYPAQCCDVSPYGSVRCPDGANVLKCASGTCP